MVNKIVFHKIEVINNKKRLIICYKHNIFNKYSNIEKTILKKAQEIVKSKGLNLIEDFGLYPNDEMNSQLKIDLGLKEFECTSLFTYGVV